MTAIIEPGVYDIPVAEYLADPLRDQGGSLSASGAKLLLPPYVPADFAHRRATGPEGRRAYDFGHLAHREILGVGDEHEIVHKVNRSRERVPCVTSRDLDTESAKSHIEEIREAGKVPILAGDIAVVKEMARKLHEHPEAAALLTNGTPEQSAFWRDPDAGIWRRGRFDILPDAPTKGRRIVADYKTARDVHPAQFVKKIADYGYDLQAANYLDAIYRLLGDRDTAFVWVVQQSTPPYHVAVIEATKQWIQMGAERMWVAAHTYARCTAEDHWPAYPGITPAPPPPAWVANAHDDLMDRLEKDSAA